MKRFFFFLFSDLFLKTTLLTFIILIFSIRNTNAQQGIEGIDYYAKNNLKVTPLSPDAASLGKYGGLPVNLSSGKLNYNIPLHTIKAKDFSLPISLSYSYSGRRVLENPSSVGLGWNLIAGGVINRQLRGFADEKVDGFFSNASTIRQYADGTSPDLCDLNLIDPLPLETGDSKDTKPDKFSISIGDINATFYINEFNQTVFTPYKDYYISYEVNNGNIISFLLVDDKGIRYTFDKAEMTISDPFSFAQSNPPCSAMNNCYNSSWHISEIELVNGEKIFFEYINETVKHFKDFNISETKILDNIDPMNDDTGLLENNGFNLEVKENKNYTDVFRQKLTKITYKGGFIDFIYSNFFRTIQGSITAQYNLDEIRVNGVKSFKLNGNSEYDYELNKKYIFNYQNPSDKFRKLKEINLFDKYNVQQPFYKFDYYIGETGVYQDIWGYYSNNSSGTINLNTTIKGALEKINYPTGGFTNISYELNETRFDQIINDEFIFDVNCGSVENSLNHDTSQDILVVGTGNEPVYDSLTVHINSVPQIIKIETNLTAEQDPNHQAELEASYTIEFTGGDVQQICTQCENDKYIIVIPGNDDIISTNVCYYKITEPTSITITGMASTTTFGDVSMGASVSYALSASTTIQTKKIGGLRVNQTKDCSSNNDCIEKRFKYIREDGTPSTVLLNSPIKKNDSNITVLLQHEGYWMRGIRYNIAWRKDYTRTNPSPVTTSMDYFLYNRIEVYEGNEQNPLSQTKTIHHFTSNNNIGGTTYINPNPSEIELAKNGLLEKVEYYKKINPIRYNKIKEVRNNYTLLHDSDIFLGDSRCFGLYHVRANDFIGLTCIEEGVPMPLCECNNYTRIQEVKPFSYVLSNTVTKNYFEQGEVLTDSTAYYYDGKARISSQIRKTSKNDIIRISYSYPSNSSSVIGASYLVGKHMLSQPIMIRSYLNGVEQYEVQKEHTITTLGIPVLDRIKKSKENGNLDEVFVYHKYDDETGNVIELSKASSPDHTYYIWGYNKSQVIAKIDNFTSAEANNINNEIDLAILKSNEDDDRTISYNGKEGELREALDAIRNHSSLENSMITTYTYDPLIGVTSITQPNGETTYYEYDNFNRLKLVKDSNGNILKENEYHYKD